MPIYKMNGRRDGKQKYRVRINYIDALGKARQVDRVTYGSDEAKLLELKLQQDIRQDAQEAEERGFLSEWDYYVFFAIAFYTGLRKGEIHALQWSDISGSFLSGQEAPAKRMTLRELFREYCNIRKNEMRESTLDKFKHITENHILPELGGLKLSKITPPILAQWKMSIEDKGLALTTKQSAYSPLRAMLNYAVKMEYIPKNPLDKIGNFKSSGDIKKEMDFYTPQEFKRFLSAARQNAQEAEERGFLSEWDYYVFFAIAFYTGLRKGEIHALQWSDISGSFLSDAQEAEERGFLSEWDYYVFFAIAFYTGLRKGEIHALQWSDISGSFLSVKRSIAQKLKGGDRETAPKNKASVRTLQIPVPLLTILEEHKKRWKKHEGFSASYRVCGGEKCLRDTSVENRNKRFAEAAGVKKIRIHDFRHSHVSLLANKGINIQEIARRLGHSNIEMTWNTYSHLYPKEEERAIKILNKIV